MTLEDSPGLLLIMNLDGVSEASRAPIAQAAEHLGSTASGGRIIELQSGLQHDPALRSLVDCCSAQGGCTWLLAELPRVPAIDGAYRPMVDRSEQYAASLDAWRRSEGSLPPLKPGEMVRLG
jgi:hypothetical protein